MTADPGTAMGVLLVHVEPEEHEREQDYPGLIHMATDFLDHSRWSVTYLDVYYHPASDTYAGVTYQVGATEYQDGQDQDATPVPIEIDPRPRYRIRRTTP